VPWVAPAGDGQDVHLYPVTLRGGEHCGRLTVLQRMPLGTPRGHDDGRRGEGVFDRGFVERADGALIGGQLIGVGGAPGQEAPQVQAGGGHGAGVPQAPAHGRVVAGPACSATD